MTALEIRFLDEYKRLNAVCSDMFSDQNGLTAYLNCMDEAPRAARQEISSWEEDRRALIRLRHVRNEIAHNTDCSSCSDTDLQMLFAFYDRLLSGKDPLTCYYRKNERKQTRPEPYYQAASKQFLSQRNEPIKKDNRLKSKRIIKTFLIVFLVFLMALFALAYFLFIKI